MLVSGKSIIPSTERSVSGSNSSQRHIAGCEATSFTWMFPSPPPPRTPPSTLNGKNYPHVRINKTKEQKKRENNKKNIFTIFVEKNICAVQGSTIYQIHNKAPYSLKMPQNTSSFKKKCLMHLK